MNTLARFLSALGTLLLVVSLSAQPAPDAKFLTDALELRADMAEAVKQKAETPEAALARLKAHASPSGLKLDRDADFAFAAIDVGQRLIAASKPDEAESFFLEAEKSLEAVIKMTPDTAARDKAMLLQNLAFIHGHYLDKASQAKTDIDQAIALQPGDTYLQKMRDSLAKGKAEDFKDKPKN